MHKDLLTSYYKAAAQCTFHAAGNRLISPKTQLQELAECTGENEARDQYGEGAIIEDFERAIAKLLGKERAVFMPSGTMAQNIALKVWSETRDSCKVAMHETSHLLLHEEDALSALYGLQPVIIGTSRLVPSLDDIRALDDVYLAAVLLELPMREIGGQLPPWESLVLQSQYLRERNIPLHMDGARLWQCPPAYDKTLIEIASLFDSIYLSFYKDIGGISGACLVGSNDFIAKAKIWLRRAGGNLYSLYPYVVAARYGLNIHLPQMSQRRSEARWLAEQFNQINRFKTWPNVPMTNMFRLRIDANAEEFLERSITWMTTQDICLIRTPYEINQQYLLAEITIGDGFYKLTKQQWQDAIQDFSRVVLNQ